MFIAIPRKNGGQKLVLAPVFVHQSVFEEEQK